MAKDVIASHKVLYAIALFPIIMFAPGLVVFIYSWYYAFAWDDIIYMSSITTFIWPFYFYFSVLFADDGVRNLKKLYVNTMALFLPQRL